MLRILAIVAIAAGCHAGGTPQLTVLGVHNAPSAHEIVFVQVTNPETRPMRLTKLEYTFAADGATVSTGEMPLERDIPAGSTVVVEVPLDASSPASRPMTLEGKLTAELDQMVQIFQVSAQIKPH